MQSIKEYIVDGITIDKTKDGYRVFTKSTQWFNITDLDELLPHRFEEEIGKLKEQENSQTELLGEFFKDLFEQKWTKI